MRRSYSLSQKLLALAAVGLLPTLLAGAIGFEGLRRSSTAAAELSRAVSSQRSQMLADMMHDNLRGVAALARLEANSGRTGAREALEAEAQTNGQRMISAIDTVRLTATDAAVRQAATELRATVVQYADLALRSTVAAGDPGGVPVALSAALEANFDSLETKLGVLGDRVEASASALSIESQQVSRNARYLLLAICLVAVLAVAGGALAIIRSIRRPISELAAHAELIATGDFSRELMYTSRDEIGSLADSFRAVTIFAQDAAAASMALSRGDLTTAVVPRSAADVLAHSVNGAAATLRRLDQEIGTLVAAGRRGELQVRANPDAFEGAYRELMLGINAMLDETLAPIQEATTVLDKVSRRNLRVRVHGAFLGDHARLTSALNSTLDQLESALREVHVASTEVSAAAGQIADGSQSMAQGASDQASALEEINASLQTLDALSAHSTEQATEVQQLSNAARVTVDEGVMHMQRLDEAIEAINGSVGETSRIMRTIDEIAFQTNLLALNAAVEAARAGDAGRGFAVVADEVRLLALRTAEESRRSSDVIARSLADAARGVELKTLTQARLHEISQTVGKVSLAMTSIAQSSAQQADGIRQIVASTDHMSRITQQAAANAEESAAAAQELTSQAESLHDMVGGFELSHGARGTANDASISPERSDRWANAQPLTRRPRSGAMSSEQRRVLTHF